MGVSLVLAIVIFLIFFMSSKKENFTNQIKNDAVLKIENQTIEGLMVKDSDGDRVLDWEEALWGTDKDKVATFNETPDANYIENKKRELNIDQTATDENLTETDKFARQFFSAYSAMKVSGQVDSQTINNFGTALGQKIVNPALIDRYSQKDIKIGVSDDANSREKYYNTVKKLFESYQSVGVGEELIIVSGGLTAYSSTGKESQPTQLLAIAGAYQDFAQKVIDIAIPKSLTEYHLRIANSSNNTGISVYNMAKITGDPIVGLSGLSQYQKYSEELATAVSDLETTLFNSDTI